MPPKYIYTVINTASGERVPVAIFSEPGPACEAMRENNKSFVDARVNDAAIRNPFIVTVEPHRVKVARILAVFFKNVSSSLTKFDNSTAHDAEVAGLFREEIEKVALALGVDLQEDGDSLEMGLAATIKEGV